MNIFCVVNSMCSQEKGLKNKTQAYCPFRGRLLGSGSGPDFVIFRNLVYLHKQVFKRWLLARAMECPGSDSPSKGLDRLMLPVLLLFFQPALC